MTNLDSPPPGAQNPAPILRVSDLSIDVPTRRGPARVVNGISFTVGRGEALGVVGESGCGKSITMLGLMGLLPSGARTVGGEAVFEDFDLLRLSRKGLREVRGERIGMVFQDPGTSLNPVMRIGDQIAEPLIQHRGMSRAEARARAGELLKQVGIPGGAQRIDNYPHQLSGGMRQRVMIAIAIACEPALLIADEPTTALDVTIQAQIVGLVRDLRRRIGIATIWITHDLALVSGLVDRIIVLYAGTIVEEAPVDTLFADPVHPYTRALLSSLPRMDDDAEQHRLPAIPGTPPDPGSIRVGCPFAPRCPLRVERCVRDTPRLVSVPSGTAGHRAACWVTAGQSNAQ